MSKRVPVWLFKVILAIFIGLVIYVLVHSFREGFEEGKQAKLRQGATAPETRVDSLMLDLEAEAGKGK